MASTDDNTCTPQSSTSSLASIASPSEAARLPFQDKFSTDKYLSWLSDLSDDQLRDEEYRCQTELLSCCSGIIANAVATPFTAVPTAGLSLAAHAASVSYKQAKRVYYHSHVKLCNDELSKRNIYRRNMSDSQAMKTAAKGVVRTVVPSSIFKYF